MIYQRQQMEGWSTGIIPRLAADLKNELPEIKGFSERNIGRMIAFFRAYPGMHEILPQPVAKLDQESKRLVTNMPQAVAQMFETNDFPILQQLAAKMPWGHNILLMEKVKDLPTRIWYMQQTIEQGWSRDILSAMMKGKAHERQGQAVNNFSSLLPAPQSDLAQQLLKDPYLFDFLTMRVKSEQVCKIL